MLAFIGDPHLRDGDDLVSRFRLYSFGEALRICSEKNVTDIVITGDLFDKPVVSPRLVQNVRDLFGRYKRSRYFILAGNHDTKLGVGCALSYIADDVDVIAIMDNCARKMLDGSLVYFVPYHPTSTVEYGLELLSAVCGHVDVIVGHFGVYDDKEVNSCWAKSDRWFMRRSNLLDIMQENAVYYCVFGHKHNMAYDANADETIGIGSLSPCSKSESGMFYGNLAFYNKSLNLVSVDLNAVPGYRYYVDGDLSRSLNVCTIHTKEDEGFIYTEFDDMVTDPEDLLGKHILMTRGLSSGKDKLFVEFPDPGEKFSMQEALKSCLASLPGGKMIEQEALYLVTENQVREADCKIYPRRFSVSSVFK